jgi:streptomycin 6-kinase
MTDVAVGVEVRAVDGVDEVHAVEALFASIWRTTAERPPVNADVLRAMAHTGCYVAGAYEGSRLVGASAGFLGGGAGEELHLHSHITGVLPDAQGRHIGLGLKLHQRQWCLDRGVEVVTWTFDPLVRRNAWFNLHRLGADIVEFHRDFYGAMTDGVNAGSASDRCVVRWSLPTAAARPPVVAGDGDVVVAATPSSRGALRHAFASGLRVAGMTAEGEYVFTSCRRYVRNPDVSASRASMMALMDLDDDVRQRLVRRFGDDVLPWLDRAPEVLVSLASRWTLELGALIPRGTMSVVVRCVTADGRPAILKLSPEVARIGREAAALRMWSTPHAPTVLESDAEIGALLLEAIDPGTPITDASPAAAGEMLRSLHVPMHDGFPPVTDRITWLFDAWDRELRRRPELLDLLPGADLPERGRALAMRLAADPVPTVLLHGDLNPGNLLDGGSQRGIVAIDPAPCIGDPAFDATDLVFAAATDPDAIRRHVGELAPAAGVATERLLAWCIAFAGMDGCERAERDGPTDASRGLLTLAVEAGP